MQIIYSNELYHHGVRGMKWGVRNAKERVSAGMARSRAGHETAKKYANAYGRSKSLPKRAAKYALLGYNGTKAYDTYRAMGKGRLGSYGRVWGANVAGNMVGNAVGRKIGGGRLGRTYAATTIGRLAGTEAANYALRRHAGNKHKEQEFKRHRNKRQY